jgi:hypothetical protein
MSAVAGSAVSTLGAEHRWILLDRLAPSVAADDANHTRNGTSLAARDQLLSDVKRDFEAALTSPRYSPP